MSSPQKDAVPAEPVVRVLGEKAGDFGADGDPNPSPESGSTAPTSEYHQKPLGSAKSMWGWLVLNLAV
ncbi:hypothetical protein MMYC01_203747 [Madurella mycetomatis]|uniref:Uncharacterized protein n=1 Tax=Madurella mycetomatis TaxID=100816 RepID=A0A175VSI2_9PEZI|nr:hypothetical protein MMYC01_209237 [Madurella mycetomatis]KXX79879.1 hypothetical protein MMYC01_203747 [Madurella mycetomatis]